MSSHYQMCLKMSNENKITVKNAFELHLINLMGDMVLKDGDVDFKLAAYTLEAGSKIYSCRVDVLNTKVNRCMNALMMKSAGKDDDDDDDDAEEGGAAAVEDENNQNVETTNAKKDKEKKKKKRRKKVRLSGAETKAITIDLGTISGQQIDPLFDKFMHMDLSCSHNLLLSSLLPLNETQRFIFNSDDPLPTSAEDARNGLGVECLATCVRGSGAAGGQGEGGEEWLLGGGVVSHGLGCPVASMERRKVVSISKLKAAFQENLKEHRVICPTFRDFESRPHEFITPLHDNIHRFDPTSDDEDHHQDYDDFGGADDDNEGNDLGIHLLEDDTRASLHEKSTFSKTFEQLNKTINSIKGGDLSSLRAALVADKDGVPVFKEDFLNMWNGPTLWKNNKASKGAGSHHHHAVAAGLKKVLRKAKEPVYVKFEAEDVKVSEVEEEVLGAGKMKSKRKKIKPEVGSVAWHFQTTNVVRVKVEDSIQLLPEPYKYSQFSLNSLFIVKDVKLTVKNNNTVKKTLEVPVYDYDNPDDKLNYCPPATEGENYDDDDNVEAFEGACDDDDDGHQENVTLTDGQNIFGDDNDHVFGADDDDDDDILTGSRLLPEPEKVVFQKIDYVKSAKNIDVKKIKEKMIVLMQEMMSQPQDATKELQFSLLYKKVLKRLTSKEANEFSYAMGVSSLLQISNEKSLRLRNTPEFDEVFITMAKKTD